MSNILSVTDRAAFRAWLEEHAGTEEECYVRVTRGQPVDDEHFWYIDAVEEALCFGWIDSTARPIDGVRYQRFSPRKKNSPWTELNKERVRRLEKLGLMHEAGRKVLPPMGKRSFTIDPDIVSALKKARVWSKFRSFPQLYQRVRAYNITFFKRRNPDVYETMLEHLIAETRSGRMYGEWDDYGRLSEYSDGQ